MKPWLGVLVATLLVSCSSNSGSGEVMRMVRAGVQAATSDDKPADAAQLTRAQIEELDLAMVRLHAETLGLEIVAVGTYADADRITYVAGENRSIVLRGALISSARGFGFDLEPVAVLSNDPLVALRPPADWPASWNRRYQLDGRGPDGTLIMVTCRPSLLGNENVEIVEQTYSLRRIDATCTDGQGTTFKNTHLVDRSGFVWQSRQWTGERQGYIRYDVLEPLEL